MRSSQAEHVGTPCTESRLDQRDDAYAGAPLGWYGRVFDLRSRRATRTGLAAGRAIARAGAPREWEEGSRCADWLVSERSRNVWGFAGGDKTNIREILLLV